MSTEGYNQADTLEWGITPEEFSRNFMYYHCLTPPGHLFSGERAREFFLQTTVPPQELGLIWDLSDVDGDGCLDTAEFCVAMHLIHHYLQGFFLPSSLPLPLAHVCLEAKRPRLPTANEEHVLKCKKAFEAFQKNIANGVLSGEASKYLLGRSNLSKPLLYHIWKLADVDKDGHLTFMEFTIAMHLVFLSKLGFLLPVYLDPSSVLPLSVMQGKEKYGQTSTNQTTPIPLATPTLYEDNPFITDGFTNLLTRQFLERDFVEYEGNPFLPVEGELFADPSANRNYPQQYHISSGCGLHNGRYLESLELPSKLSIIPEESSMDEQSLESCDSSQRSPDLSQKSPDTSQRSLDQKSPPDLSQKSPDASQRSHDSQRSPDSVPSLQSHESNKKQHNLTHGHLPVGGPDGGIPWYLTHRHLPARGPDGGVPWYQQETSQDAWQTTPAYRREEVWPAENRPHLKNAQVALVTEETVPSLQVAMPVDLPKSRETTPSPLLHEEEELTLKELEGISQASKRFLTDVKNSEDVKNIRTSSIRGLQDTIRDIENSSNQSGRPKDPPGVGGSVEEVGYGQTREEILTKLENFEAEIWMSLVDIDPKEEEGQAVKSHDHHRNITTTDHHRNSTTTPQRSHDYAKTKVQENHWHEVDVKNRYCKHLPAAPEKLHSLQTTAAVQETSGLEKDKPICVKDDSRHRRTEVKKHIMDDLDNLLEGELASINEMFHQFEIKDKKTEERIKTEQEELAKLQSKKDVGDLGIEITSLEEVSRRRSLESLTVEKQWKLEMEALERDRLKALQQEQVAEDPETDTVLENLDNELRSLIQSKEEEVKLTQKEKLLRAQQEQEERERMEKEKEKRKQENPVQEMTVEEWITWMEEKKKHEMTPAQFEEYQRRKMAYIEKEKIRAQQRKEEEEEKKKRTREKMEDEMRLYRQRQQEITESRLTDEELRLKQEEMAQKKAEESRLRKERGQKMRMDDKKRELEELKPKARSALAARWEESVKSQSSKGHTATVLTGHIKGEDVKGLDREMERLVKRLSGGFQNGGKPINSSAAEEERVKRNSVI